jgi:hypothetical protein
MYIVHNNTKSVHAHYLASAESAAMPGKMVRLLPGTNEVPDEEWEALVQSEGSMTRRMVEELFTDDGRPMLQAEKVGEGFKALGVKQAKAFVLRCGDLLKLREYLASEMRPPVAEALQKRITQLTATSEKPADKAPQDEE